MKHLIQTTFLSLAVLLAIAGAQHTLTLKFLDFGPHVGQKLAIRVVEDSSSLEVGRKTLDTLMTADTTVNMYVLMPGKAYTINAYADFNQNGEYDDPPVDHAWQYQLDPVDGNTEMEIVHNTDFTEILWPVPRNISLLSGRWEGFWMNPTFGVSDSATGMLDEVGADVNLSASGRAWGLFGNPDAREFGFEGQLGDNSYEAALDAVLPWGGSLFLHNGEFEGVITYEAQGITAEVWGNFGPNQIIAYYEMSGVNAVEYTVFRREFTQTRVKGQANFNRASDFVLYDNYPNPFNPSTTIIYHLPREAQVRVDVYNVVGTHVMSLVDARQTAGQHSVEFSGIGSQGAELSSGIYFYRLQAVDGDGKTITKMKKMSLIR